MQRRGSFVVLLVGLLVGALAPPALAATPAVTEILIVANRAGSGGFLGQTEVTRSPGVTNLALHIDAEQDATIPIGFPFGGDNAYLWLDKVTAVDIDAPFALEVTGDGGSPFAVDFPNGFWFRPDGDDGVFVGGAPPGEDVTVSYGFGGPSVTTTVPAGGEFTIDLADDGFVGPLPAGATARLDLEITGADGTLFHIFEDWDLPRFDIQTSGGDRTVADVSGWGLTAGMPVVVNGVVQAGNYATEVWFSPMDISNGTPGDLTDDVLEVTTQGRSFTIPVPPIAVTDVDLAADDATGIGPPNATVLVSAYTDGGSDTNNAVLTNASGEWSFDFSGVPATDYARVRVGIPFADRPDGLGNDLYDEVEIGSLPPGMPTVHPELYLDPGASTPPDALFYFSLPGTDGEPVELTWTPNEGTGGTVEVPLDRPPGWSTGQIIVPGEIFGDAWDPTAGGTLDISGSAGDFSGSLPPARVSQSGRDIVLETDPGLSGYLSLTVLGQEFDGEAALANASGIATYQEVLPVAGALHDGTVRVVAGDGSVTSAAVTGGETVVPVGPDGGTLFVPMWETPPGVVMVGPGTDTGLELVASSYAVPVPSGWDPAAEPIRQYDDPPWDDRAGVPVSLRGPDGPVRVPTGRTVDVAVPLSRTPQPDEDVYLGIWTEEHGWEVAPPADVTVCLDTSLEGCDGSPAMHVAARVPHASTYVPFFGNPAGEILDLARASGPDRIATAIELSKTAYPDGAEVALVARSDDFADALAAVPLAAAAEAPVLLNTRDGLDSRVAAELTRLGASTVLLMGGEAAQSASVATAVGALSGVTSVERRAGADRFETAGKIAADAVARWQAAGDSDAGDHVIVALGAHPTPSRAWPDALSSGQLAAAAHAPILLVASGAVPPATTAAITDLGATRASVIGGTAAISTEVADALGVPTTRYGGADRFQTSLVVAEAAYAAGATDRDVLVATGLNFPDGLAAGAATAARGGLLVLVDGGEDGPGAAVTAWLEERVEVTRWVRIAGGRVAVSDAAMDRVRSSLTP